LAVAVVVEAVAADLHRARGARAARGRIGRAVAVLVHAVAGVVPGGEHLALAGSPRAFRAAALHAVPARASAALPVGAGPARLRVPGDAVAALGAIAVAVGVDGVARLVGAGVKPGIVVVAVVPAAEQAVVAVAV